jgi:hypothetical protein
LLSFKPENKCQKKKGELLQRLEIGEVALGKKSLEQIGNFVEKIRKFRGKDLENLLKRFENFVEKIRNFR